MTFLSFLTICLALKVFLADARELTSERRMSMMVRIEKANGFLAALDQSGGSTPKALKLYRFPGDRYVEGDKSMFDAIHSIRTRIVTSPSFRSDRILGAILFEDTMTRELHGESFAEYLWDQKGIVPFLKVDQGLLPEEDGVQMMKPIPNLEALLAKAKRHGIFGTKMRSVIKSCNRDGIKAVVEQQFAVGKQICATGLVPIIEPEVDINSPEKQQCEEVLKKEFLDQLGRLEYGQRVILKVTLPCLDNFYQECIDHPNCIRVVALSGGFSQQEAINRLGRQRGMIASFSRALTEGLTYDMSDEEFDHVLDQSIRSISAVSKI